MDNFRLLYFAICVFFVFRSNRLFTPVTSAIELCVGILVAKLVGFRFAYARLGQMFINRGGRGLRVRRVRCAPVESWYAWPIWATAPVNERGIANRTVLYQLCLSLSLLLVGCGMLAASIYFVINVRSPWLVPLQLVALAIPVRLLVNAYFYIKASARMIQTVRARGEDAASLLAETTLIGAEYVLAQRPRDWDASLIERANLLVDGEPQGRCYWWAYNFALDRGDVDAARSYIRRLIPDTSVETECEVDLFEAAYFAAHYDNDPVTARVYLEKARGLCRIENQTWLRAEAAVLLAEGKHQEAEARAREGLAATRDATQSGTLKAEVEWLRDILQRTSGAAPSHGN